MATELLQVAAVTAPDNWILTSGPDKVVAVNSPTDDDATRIHALSAVQQQYSLAASAIPAGSTINSVSTFARLKSSDGLRTFKVDLILGGNTTTGPTRTPGTSYTDFTDAAARPGGGAWALADLASTEVNLAQVSSGSGNTQHCTSLWLIIDYTAPAPTDTGAFLQLF